MLNKMKFRLLSGKKLILILLILILFSGIKTFAQTETKNRCYTDILVAGLEMTKENLLSQEKLLLISDSVVITKFKIFFFCSEDLFAVSNDSEKITEKMKKLVSTCVKKGDIVVFDEIEAKTQHGKIIKLPPVFVKIK